MTDIVERLERATEAGLAATGTDEAWWLVHKSLNAIRALREEVTQTQEAFMRLCEALGIQASAHAHLEVPGILALREEVAGLRAGLGALVDAIDQAQAFVDLEAGCEGEGAVVQACRAIDKPIPPNLSEWFAKFPSEDEP